jgi:hypothetical protein
MTLSPELGRIAYEAYQSNVYRSQGVSAPSWDKLALPIRDAWHNAADAVKCTRHAEVMNICDDILNTVNQIWSSQDTQHRHVSIQLRDIRDMVTPPTSQVDKEQVHPHLAGNIQYVLDNIIKRLEKLEKNYIEVLTTSGPRVHPSLFDNVIDRLDKLEEWTDSESNSVPIHEVIDQIVDRVENLENTRKALQDTGITELRSRVKALENAQYGDDIRVLNDRVDALTFNNQVAEKSRAQIHSTVVEQAQTLAKLVSNQETVSQRAYQATGKLDVRVCQIEDDLTQLRLHLQNEVARLHEIRTELDESLALVINHPLHGHAARDVEGLKKALEHIQTLISINTPTGDM